MTGLIEALRSGRRQWRIGMINGPNMPNLGRRDPAVYGSVESMEDLERRVAGVCEGLGVSLAGSVCSNSEADILGWIHANTANLEGLVVNPAGLTTFGEATRHALQESRVPFVEVHFGNIARRQVESRFTATSAGACFGLKRHSYTAAVVALVGALDSGDVVAGGQP